MKPIYIRKVISDYHALEHSQGITVIYEGVSVTGEEFTRLNGDRCPGDGQQLEIWVVVAENEEGV